MSWRYRKPGAIEGHFSDQLFNARLTGLISVSELKNAVAVTAAKSVMAFRVLDHGGRPVQTDNEDNEC
ncbi:hypothetical protein Asd1617_00444 [Shigella dysenteriae 1617]|uniref:Uncharacterized protein n=1 Tax=Shigella dysenteriae 1617 TaxID=754093 RepID=A0A0A6ZNV3_SHIDY|nr:hypothetical protein Asd1617_00444 [Shigella dysenteriae 1617]